MQPVIISTAAKNLWSDNQREPLKYKNSKDKYIEMVIEKNRQARFMEVEKI
jgi:hypothetical protein